MIIVTVCDSKHWPMGRRHGPVPGPGHRPLSPSRTGTVTQRLAATFKKSCRTRAGCTAGYFQNLKQKG
eukprot:762994-Hanusia_phi.AAC.5